MTELLDEFEQKRESLRNIVEDHVRNRDRLSEESQRFAAERDQLNSRVRELRDVAKERISEKSSLIEQVQKLRAEKEEFFGRYQEYRKEYRKVRGEIPVKDIDMRDIKIRERELQRLETKQQTTQLTKTEEQKVVSDIRRLTNEVKKMKKLFEEAIGQNEVVRDLTEKMRKEKESGEALKKQVEEISQKISGLSEEINSTLQELDETRRKADNMHEQFVKFNEEAELEHRAFVKSKNDLRDMEKAIYTMRTKARTTKKKEKESELQQKATTLYDKFKNGEQLTTEDLLILQKAGFL